MHFYVNPYKIVVQQRKLSLNNCMDPAVFQGSHSKPWQLSVIGVSSLLTRGSLLFPHLILQFNVKHENITLKVKLTKELIYSNDIKIPIVPV